MNQEKKLYTSVSLFFCTFFHQGCKSKKKGKKRKKIKHKRKKKKMKQK